MTRRYQWRIVRPRWINGAWQDCEAASAREAARIGAAAASMFEPHPRGDERLDVRCPASGEVWEDAPRTAP